MTIPENAPTFEVDNLHSVGQIVDRRDHLLRIEGDFSIVVGDAPLAVIECFTPVELAGALARWLRVPSEQRDDFEFESMDGGVRSDVPDRFWQKLVWFRRARDGWTIGMALEEVPDSTTYALETLDRVSRAYIARLEAAVRDQLGIDIRPALGIIRA
jgi:hypothetical protein